MIAIALTDPCTPGVWTDLTDVTLADEVTDSIGIGGQNCNKCKWRHLVPKFAINAKCAIWWPNLQPIQVVPPGT